MIKKWVVFILMSILLLILVLVIGNFSSIVQIVKNFPIDRLVSYLLGAATMFVANLLVTRNKKTEN